MKLNEYIREFFIDEEFPNYTLKHPRFWRMMRNFIRNEMADNQYA